LCPIFISSNARLMAGEIRGIETTSNRGYIRAS